MRMTTGLISAMDPLQPAGSPLPAAEDFPSTAATAGLALRPPAAAAAAPRPVYCRKLRRLRRDLDMSAFPLCARGAFVKKVVDPRQVLSVSVATRAQMNKPCRPSDAQINTSPAPHPRT